MNIKLIEILKMSSLRSMLSDSEIDEVHEELSGDFNDFLEEETERITEEVKGTSMIEDLQYDIRELKKELADVSLPNSTLVDVMTSEWVKNNWEGIVKLYNLNNTPKEILDAHIEFLKLTRAAGELKDKVEDNESIKPLLEMRRDTDLEIQKRVDIITEIHEKTLKIVNASYGSETMKVNVDLLMIVEGRKISNKLVGYDPAPKKKKFLHIVFNIGGIDISKTFVEGEKIVF